MNIPKLGEFKYPYPGKCHVESNLKEKKGLLIEIEGLDGSGKSSQLKMIEEKLKKKYSKIYVGNFIHSEYIRDILLRTKYENCDEYTFTFMYLMGLTNFYNYEVAKKLSEGYIVVLDRYIDTIRSKALVKNIDKEWLDNILSIYRKPDISIFIDVPPNICLERKKKDNKILSFWECGCEIGDDSLRFEYNSKLYENNFIEHQKKMRKIFIDDYNSKFIIDGTKDKNEVNNDIMNIIDDKIGELYE